MEAVKAVERAQRRTLDHWRIRADLRLIPVDHIAETAHVLVAGTGSPLVMINGIGVPGAMFAPLMAHLQSRHRLYVVDLPGYGLSDADRGFPSDFRAAHIGFLRQVLEGLELARPPLLANSLGALIGFWFALDHPDRCGDITAVGCPAITMDTSAPLPMRLLGLPGLGAALARLSPPSPRQVRALARMVHQDPLPPTIAELLEATQRTRGYRTMFRGSLRRLLRLTGANPALALGAEELGRVRTPVRLIWGDRDPMGNLSAGRAIHAALADASLHVVPGGHAPWLNAPRAVADALGLDTGPARHESTTKWL